MCLRDSRSSENLRFASFLRKSRVRSVLTSAFLENVKMATEYSVVKPYEPTYVKSIQSQVNAPKWKISDNHNSQEEELKFIINY